MFGSRIINRCRSAVLMMNGGLNIGTPVRWSTTVIKMPKLMVWSYRLNVLFTTCNFDEILSLLNQNAANGSLDKWVKNEGDAFDKGEPLAELTLDGITIGLQLKESGILAKRILTEGQVGDVGDAIAIVADTEDTYKQYLADVEAAEQAAAAAEAAKKESPNSINILRHIKHMIQLGILHDESGCIRLMLSLTALSSRY